MIRCRAITQKGNHCKNHPIAGSDFCRIHQANGLNLIFDDFVEQEDAKNISLCQKVQTLDALAGLDVSHIYPEFRIKEEETLGYFNPFVSGGFSDLAELGRGSSVLALLPFYERVIVNVIAVPEGVFSQFYGVDFPTFNDLVQAGRVLPILPISVPGAEGKDKVEFFAPLYRQHWPTRDRTFRLTQRIAVSTLNSGYENAAFEFDRILMDSAKEIFGGEAAHDLMDFIRLCKEAAYRGDPLLIFNWIVLAKKYKDLFKRQGVKDWAPLTIEILKACEQLFQIGLLVPGASPSYSDIAFEWLKNELQIKSRNAEMLGLDKYNHPKTGILGRLMAASHVITFEEIAVLRKGFIHEPIEAVNDISKYLHWLEHSTNIQENHRIMKAFSTHIREGRYKDALLSDVNVVEEVVSELNAEIAMVDFDMRASRALVQIAATFSSAVAEAALVAAIAVGELSSTFSLCGVIAASILTGQLADTLVNKIGSLAYRKNAPFLLWKRLAFHNRCLPFTPDF